MGITITCYDPTTGGFKEVPVDTIGQGGAGLGIPQVRAFGAKRINLSMADVQHTIQEGRASGSKPFNIYNSASPWDSAQ
jgi:hypothetical protein